MISASDGSWFLGAGHRDAAEVIAARRHPRQLLVEKRVDHEHPTARGVQDVKLAGGSVVEEAIRCQRHENPWSQYIVLGTVATGTRARPVYRLAHPVEPRVELVLPEERPPAVVGCSDSLGRELPQLLPEIRSVLMMWPSVDLA